MNILNNRVLYHTAKESWQSAIYHLCMILVMVGLFFLPVSTSLSVCVLVGSVLSLSIENLRKQLWSRLHEPVVLLASAMLIYGFIRCFNHSVSPGTALHSYKKYAVHLILCVTMMSLSSERRTLHLLSYAVIAGAVCFSALDLLDRLGFIAIESLFHKPKNHFLSEIEFSEYCALACVLLLSFIDDHNRAYKRQVLLYGLMIYMAAYLLFVNAERTGVVVVMGMLFYYLSGSMNIVGRYRFIILLILLTTVLSIAFSPSLRPRIQEGVNDIRLYQQGQPRTSLGLRFIFAKASLELIVKRPLFGYGAGSFPELYREQVGIGITPTEQTVGDPHNQWLHLWVEYGLVGASLFTAWLVSFWLSEKRALVKQYSSTAEQIRMKPLLRTLIVGFSLACVSTCAFYRARSGMLFVVFASLYFICQDRLQRTL